MDQLLCPLDKTYIPISPPLAMDKRKTLQRDRSKITPSHSNGNPIHRIAATKLSNILGRYVYANPITKLIGLTGLL